MDNRIYQLEIYFNENIENIDIFEFEDIIQTNIEYIDREYIFYDKVSLEVYNPFIINSYIRYNFDENPVYLKEKLERLPYIKNIKMRTLRKQNKERNSTINISVDKIPKIVNDVDKIFYIRKKMSKYIRNISEDKRESFSLLLSELSELKYNIKKNVFNLRIVEIDKEIESIYMVLKEYINILGLDIDIKIKHNDIKIDKIMFNKFRESLIDFLHSEILEFHELKNGELKLLIEIEFRQEMENLNIYIIEKGKNIDVNKVFENAMNTNILNPNYEYSTKEILNSIFNKNYINSTNELDEKERLISYIKYKNVVNELEGSIDIEYKDNIFKVITTIPLEILFMRGIVFSEGKNTYIINKNLIEDIFEFDDKNKVLLNGLQYYKYNNKNIGYISFPIEKKNKSSKRLGLLLKTDNRYTIVDISSENIFEEDIYFEKNVDSQIFIGEYLLKSLKKARILNTENIIKFFKG